MKPLDRIVLKRDPRGIWIATALNGKISAKGDSSVEAHLSLLEKAANA